MERILDVLAVFSIFLFLIVWRGLRHSRIRVEYSVSWLVAASAVLILSRSHAMLVWIAAELKVKDPILVLIFLLLLVFLKVFHHFSIVISDLKDMNVALTQRIAILEFCSKNSYGRTQEISKD